MTKLLIKGGRIIDPATSTDEMADIFIVDDKIVEIGSFKVVKGDVEIIDAKDKLVIPGVIDLHAHLRDMEQSNKETIETGTRAAIAGGVTRVLAMPNTVPRLDNAETIKRYQELIRREAKCHVHLAGAITQELQGKKLAHLNEYPPLDIRFITDDGFDVDDESVQRQAFEKAAELGFIVMIHPEIMNMAPDGVINEGAVSEKLRVPGQPNEKEWRAVERGIQLALETGARVHFTHLSTQESVQLLRKAKEKSDKITCDVTPHHLILTEELVLKIGSQAKVNPPLRTEADRQALIQAVKDGTVDCLVTDHAPHEEKSEDLYKAAFGFSGLETFIPVILTELHYRQSMDLMTVIGLFTAKPASIARWPAGRIEPGAPANLTIIDLNLEKTVDRFQLVSKGKNSPFHGMKLKGWPAKTIISKLNLILR